MTERIIKVKPDQQYYARRASNTGEITFTVWRSSGGFEGKAPNGLIFEFDDGSTITVGEQSVSGGPDVVQVVDWSQHVSRVTSNPDYDSRTGTWNGKDTG